MQNFVGRTNCIMGNAKVAVFDAGTAYFLDSVVTCAPGVKYPPIHARGGTLGISGWGCAAGTLGPLTYTRASSAEFCYPILE